MASAVNKSRSNPNRSRQRTQQASARVLNHKLSTDELNARARKLGELVCRRRFLESDRRRLVYDIGQKVVSRSRVMGSPNFTAAHGSDLTHMAELYDRFFFDGHCLSMARHHGMHFRWSKRMTSTGGKTVRTIHADRRNGQQYVKYEIVLSATLLFQTFADLQRPIRVTGVLCTNRLQAMQRILEHELIHLVEMLVWDDSCCAAPRFQSIAARMFGHTEHKHDLITQQERAARKFNIRVGSRVCFQHDGAIRTGTVNRITRRATVLVADAAGQLYDDGLRYRKYYVPISHLRPA
ncbi:MAG: SprT-like domain-containing protein [bacterium]|nr:SprT-like domain-containing protein [bacterium]